MINSNPPKKKLPQIGGGKSSGKMIQHFFGDLISVYIISPLQVWNPMSFSSTASFATLRQRRPRSQGANLPPMALRQRLPDPWKWKLRSWDHFFWRGTRMILERLGCWILWHQVFQIFNIGDVKRMQERVTRVYPRSWQSLSVIWYILLEIWYWITDDYSTGVGLVTMRISVQNFKTNGLESSLLPPHRCILARSRYGWS